jgi:flavodoxin
MKILVAYWSLTGNTQKVAEAIFDALPGEKTLKTFDEVDTLEGIDITFIGFPVMQFGLPAAARKFVNGLPGGLRIALFVTHATLNTSEELLKSVVLEKELEKCRAACSNVELLGLFHCQGELSEKTAGELMESNIPMLMEFAGMRAQTIGHPDPDELLQAGIFARAIVSQQSP